MTAPRARIEELRRRSLDAVQLAESASLAAYVEPALLRRMRHEMLPGASPAAEADLWFSDLVESATPRGIVLRTDVLDVLRENIADERRIAARRIVDEIHVNAAPIIRIEEEIIAAALDPAEPVATIERLLERALVTMRDPNRADGIIAWASRAIPALPRRARETSAARTLAAAASLRLGETSIAVGTPPPDGGLAYLLPESRASVKAGVRLLTGAVEISIPPVDDAHLVELPVPPYLGIGPPRRPEATRWVALEHDRKSVIPVEEIVVRSGGSDSALCRVMPPRGVACVAVDDGRLAVAGDDGTVEILSLDGGDAIATFRLPAPAVALSFDDQPVALCRDGVVRRLLGTGDLLEVMTGVVAPFAVRHGATIAATRGGVRFQDSKGVAVDREFRSGECVALALGDGVMAAAYADGTVVEWADEAGRQREHTRQIRAPATALAFSSDGRLAVVATFSVQIWDRDRRASVVNLQGRTVAASWSTAAELVVVLDDGFTRVDATNGHVTSRLRTYERWLAVSADGQLMAAAPPTDEIELRTISGETFSLAAVAPKPPRPAAGEHFDAVIVGSGFGGSVMAQRLAEAGQRVCLLERGQAYPPGSFPRTPDGMQTNVWDPDRGLFGLFDYWPLREADALCGAGLGGGSLIYANVLMRKDEESFVHEERTRKGYEYWPVTRADLDPHYDRVERLLKAQRFPLGEPPYDRTPKTLAFAEAASALGFEWFLVNLAITFANEGSHAAPAAPIDEPVPNVHGRRRETCRLCGECEIGCNYGSKNTLDYTYLTAAEHDGAELRTLCDVRSFEPREGGGYAVTYVIHDSQNEGTGTGESRSATITADRLILAAGALGTTSLLLRNRAAFPHLSPALGTRFSGNGELLNFARDCSEVGPDGRRVPRNVDPAHAPVTTSAIRVPGADRSPGFYLEDGGPPEFAARLLAAADPDRGMWPRLLGFLTGVRGDHGIEETPSTLSVLSFGRESADRILTLRDDRLSLAHRDSSASADYFERARSVSRDLAAALGGDLADDPQSRRPLIAHPLGGCPMGRDKTEGVVDAYGNVFGYPGLYIADGSVMPGSVGTNPCLTIAALADRFADAILNDDVSVTARRSSSPSH